VLEGQRISQENEILEAQLSVQYYWWSLGSPCHSHIESFRSSFIDFYLSQYIEQDDEFAVCLSVDFLCNSLWIIGWGWSRAPYHNGSRYMRPRPPGPHITDSGVSWWRQIGLCQTCTHETIQHARSTVAPSYTHQPRSYATPLGCRVPTRAPLSFALKSDLWPGSSYVR